jgi:hypothetical protein
MPVRTSVPKLLRDSEFRIHGTDKPARNWYNLAVISTRLHGTRPASPTCKACKVVLPRTMTKP